MVRTADNRAVVRIAVIGVGPLVGLPHARRVASLGPDVELAAVCDLDPSAAAEELSCKSYTNAVEMAKEEALHGVVIAAPTHLHTLLAKQVISGAQQRGASNCLRALLVEKPVAHTLQSADELIAAAEAAGVALLVGHQRRHSPAAVNARRILEKSNFGELRGLTCTWALLKPASYFDFDAGAPTWRGEKGKGGPVLLNLIHDVDLIRHLTGEEIELAFATTSDGARSHTSVEDSGAITLKLSGGVTCSIFFSDSAPSPWSYEFTAGENGKYPPLPKDPATGAASHEGCMQIFGARKSLSFPAMRVFGYDGAAAAVAAGTAAGGAQWQNGEAGWDAPLQLNEVSPDPSLDPDPLTNQMRHFVSVCRKECAPLCTGLDGLNSLVATLAISRSAELSRAVTPDEVRAEAARSSAESSAQFVTHEDSRPVRLEFMAGGDSDTPLYKRRRRTSKEAGSRGATPKPSSPAGESMRRGAAGGYCHSLYGGLDLSREWSQ